MDHKVRDLVEVCVTHIRQNHECGILGSELLHCRLDGLIGRIRLHGYHYTRNEVPDERQRSVLDLGSREALCMNVGYLLELQSPLQCHWELDAAPAEYGVIRQPEILGNQHGLCSQWCEPLLHQSRNLLQLLAVRVQLILRDGFPMKRDLQGDQQNHDHLSSECLCGGDADLGAGVQVHARIRQPRDARAHDVHDAERECLMFLRDLDRLQGVRGLTTL
mmetsp:Transcript_45262/g.116159  ORF Transcript_45262/g.116159 Transcript_45262/m.116159 type:complete len:219 (-) Transcript_45262:1207-1863(-)